MTADMDWRPLIDAARGARDNAYAPYSRLKVGAALLCGTDIFVGCNVENSSYPVGCCAERGAIGALVAAGHTRIDAVVIASADPIPPCGMCRQALAEFNPSAPVLLAGDEAQVSTSLDVLMPDPFLL